MQRNSSTPLLEWVHNPWWLWMLLIRMLPLLMSMSAWFKKERSMYNADSKYIELNWTVDYFFLYLMVDVCAYVYMYVFTFTQVIREINLLILIDNCDLGSWFCLLSLSSFALSLSALLALLSKRLKFLVRNSAFLFINSRCMLFYKLYSLKEYLSHKAV